MQAWAGVLAASVLLGITACASGETRYANLTRAQVDAIASDYMDYLSELRPLGRKPGRALIDKDYDASGREVWVIQPSNLGILFCELVYASNPNSQRYYTEDC